MKQLNDLETALGVNFNNKSLLEKALAHRSFLNENATFKLGSNERLEFLGDAVLELIASSYLYDKLPKTPEGDLTDIRSCLVRTTTLADMAKELNLGDYLLLSRGEEELGGRTNQTLLANAFEAIIGAVYLDQGIASAREFLLRLIKPKLDQIIANQQFKDAKSRFQEIIQAQEKATPEYQVIKEAGPDHDKIFTVALMVNNKKWAQGYGKSKQEAEEKAAKTALDKIGKK